MAFIAILLALLAAVDASPTKSCTSHTTKHIRRIWEPFAVNTPLMAFQRSGHIRRCTRSRRYDPLVPAARTKAISPDESIEMSRSCDSDRLSSRAAAEPTRSTLLHSTSKMLDKELFPIETSRRAALLQILSLSILSSSMPDSASASEIDTTGELFSPKNEMIKGGGSAAARGIKLNAVEEKASKSRKNTSLLKSSGLIQSIYEARFITYLARFLLVFDPAASAWWKKNSKTNLSIDDEPNIEGSDIDDIAREKFAEFAESVEVGLADYFLGPYGSYASVAAAKAGIAAAEPAKSSSGPADKNSLWDMIFGSQSKKQTQSTSPIAKRKSRKKAEKEATNLARQGILNLFSLLKTRYTSTEAKQQLAILFSFISKPELQPVQEIRGLLGEIDNGTIAEIELVDLSNDEDEENISRDFFRLSSRQGGGFSKDDKQVIRVEPPAPLGDEYKPANIRAIMKPTTRILRIDVIDGGEGYTASPDVIVKQNGVSRPCEACAILDRKGSVSEIIVLNPGFGYGGGQARRGEPNLPTVEIRERKLRKKISGKEVKPAKAVAELEYKVAGVDVIDGGSGYLFDQPPEVSVDLPQLDPDWFCKPAILSNNEEEDEENQFILATVTQMKSGTNGVVLDTRAGTRRKDNLTLGFDALRSFKTDPIALLPSTTRPQFSKFINDASSDVIENGYYSVMALPPPPAGGVALPSSSYRAIDPLFGGIGKAPVTKNALTLSSSQYFRLALSGAICTVLVRTALNPLELVKTKIQLGNDEEIIQLATEKASSKEKDSQESSASKPAISTTEVIQSLVEVRGPLSLFQSADITFITSIVFGLFGFGATELFRRSFSAVFFDETASGTNEFLFLFAAGLATLLTCAAGAPFEILRVRSMSTTENQGVTKVFEEFVEQNRQKRAAPVASVSSSSAVLTPGLQIEIDDIKPLWSSFNPIASRELPFAVTKFLVFDLAAGSIAEFVNSADVLSEPIQVGVGSLGLLLSAFAGALAGIAGALVSHPADLILTLSSASSREEGGGKDWKMIVKDLLEADGGVLNLFAGFPARALFFFLVIGLQFFLYDYVKSELGVGTDDLTLVLDVFYAVRQGLV
eukprot:CAMPEP_0183720514 /NCGR_PEP_ID=MMETSP0737-20130205/13110_1 /TAXON_ID=385413 /ORGANISM="Thalassiosira miniscula, Strain CCMP1093" /LENGTH=1090 /DNA_ID=CAMNT_0025950389 /DNA_START=103 /DNA_END=3375 /DNA_ORIENTATION=+